MKHTDPRPAPASGEDDGVPRGVAGRHHSADEMHNVDVAHEHSDINVRALIFSAVSLAVITALVFVLMGWTFRFLETQAVANDPEVSPLAPPATQMPARSADPAFGAGPEPRLLTDEPAVLQQHRLSEEQLLSGYGWVDEKTGVARLPIAEAKKLIVERGIAARETAATRDPALGTNRPSTAESSSGRTANGPPRGTGLPDVK